MEKRGLFQKIFGTKQPAQTSRMFELVNSPDNRFNPWDGDMFDSDIVRSAVRPKANAIGKLNAKHIRGSGIGMKINPDPYIANILEYPNPYMTMQDMLSKLVLLRDIQLNAFAFLRRDDLGFPLEVWPVPCSNAELCEVQGSDELFMKFWFKMGKFIVVPYADVIHLRKDFYSHDFFGGPGIKPLKNIMEVINTTDQGVVKAVKNSAFVRWIMTFKNILQTKDRELAIEEFTKNYLSIEKSSGVALADPRYDLKQVEDKNYVPSANQMDKYVQRLYAYFGVNDAIVQNKFTEDEWNAFYEGELEPTVIQLSKAFTKVFFSARERGFGNRIMFDSCNLAYASMKTKLGLVAMVDRGAMIPNKWCEIMGLPPLPGGDVPIRRLDTQPVNTNSNMGDGNNGDQSAGTN